MLSVVEIDPYMGSTWMPVRLYAAPDGMLDPFILGMPLIRAIRVSSDYSTKKGDLLVRCQVGNIRIVTLGAQAVRRGHATETEPTKMAKSNVNHLINLGDQQGGLKQRLLMDEDDAAIFTIDGKHAGPIQQSFCPSSFDISLPSS